MTSGLVLVLHKFVTYLLLSHLPTHLQPWDPHGGKKSMHDGDS